MCIDATKFSNLGRASVGSDKRLRRKQPGPASFSEWQSGGPVLALRLPQPLLRPKRVPSRVETGRSLHSASAPWFPLVRLCLISLGCAPTGVQTESFLRPQLAIAENCFLRCA